MDFRIPGLNNFGIERFEESVVAPSLYNLSGIIYICMYICIYITYIYIYTPCIWPYMIHHLIGGHSYTETTFSFFFYVIASLT